MTTTRPDPRDTDPLGVAEDIEAMWRAVSGQERRPADKTFTYRPPRPSRLRRLIGWWRGG